MSDSLSRPVEASERLRHVDMIRGVALFGILLMNITGFGLPMAYGDPTVYGGATGANLWAFITTSMLFEGTQRALFSMLFGASVILLVARLEAAGRPDSADIYFRRLTWMVIFGIVHSYFLLWTGEVLFFYGATGMFLYVFRHAQAKTMMTIALAGIVLGAGLNVLDSYNANGKYRKASVAQQRQAAGATLTDDEKADIEAWKSFEGDLKPDKKKIDADLAAHRGSYKDVFLFQAPHNAHGEAWVLYRFFFDMFSMMLIGMAFFRAGVLTLERPSATYWSMVVLGYTVGLATNYFELRILLDGQFSALSIIRSNWTYDIGRLAMATGHLGLLLLFCRSGLVLWLQRSLAAVGQMALSNYVSQSIVCALIFDGFGFGMYGYLQRYQLYYVVVSIWIVQLIISPIWLRHFRFGPVEWLWRSLTYRTRQPMRHDQPARMPAPMLA